MSRSLLFILVFSLLPMSLRGQSTGPSAGPSLGLGYGVTQSRLRSGEALSLEGSVPLRRWQDLQLRGEILYQRGDLGGTGCERLDARYCIGGADRNQILGVGAALHLSLGSVGPIGVTVPVGAGIYHRRTATTETEGPIEFCLDGNQLVLCPGNPALQSVSYTTHATVPGYSVGIGMTTRIRGVGLYLETRMHDLLEQDSKAGALPVSFGVRL